MHDKPKLRPIKAIPFPSAGERLVCLRDPTGRTKKTLVLPPRQFLIASLCDGAHTLDGIRAEYTAQSGETIMPESIADVIRRLDEVEMLEKDDESHS